MATFIDTAPAPTALNDAVNALGEKLGAALAHTSRAEAIESRRQIEQVLGRHLEPQFALQLVTLLLLPGSEGRELRAAFARLLSMTESDQWVVPSTRAPSLASKSDDEARFLASDEAIGVQDLAKCGECLANSALKHDGESRTSEEAAKLQWAACAQCRCGTTGWYRS